MKANKVLLVLFRLLSVVETTSSTSPIPFVATVPRGGGLISKSASDKYRESLEEQVVTLERQLRTARDQVSQLRQRKREFGRPPATTSATTVSTDAETSTLKQEIKSLSAEIKELTSANQSLEARNQDSINKIVELEQIVHDQTETIQSLKDRFEEETKELESTLSDKTKSQAELDEARQQLSDFEKFTEERIIQVANAVRLEVEQAALTKMEEMKMELESFYQEELAAEQKRSAEAVDAEKKKMRKLVKALALREQKLAAKGDQ